MLDYILTEANKATGVIVALCGLLWLWLQVKIGKEFATKTAVNKLFDRVAVIEAANIHQEHRLVTIENRLEELPDKEALHKLSIRTEQLGGDLKAVKASLDSIEASNRRIEDYLLSRKES